METERGRCWGSLWWRRQGRCSFWEINIHTRWLTAPPTNWLVCLFLHFRPENITIFPDIPEHLSIYMTHWGCLYAGLLTLYFNNPYFSCLWSFPWLQLSPSLTLNPPYKTTKWWLYAHGIVPKYNGHSTLSCSLGHVHFNWTLKRANFSPNEHFNMQGVRNRW